MVSPGERDHLAWVDQIHHRFPIELKKVGNEWKGPCPNCGGNDRFHVKAKEPMGTFASCRHCMDSSNGGLTFAELCELVWGGTQPFPRTLTNLQGEDGGSSSRSSPGNGSRGQASPVPERSPLEEEQDWNDDELGPAGEWDIKDVDDNYVATHCRFNLPRENKGRPSKKRKNFKWKVNGVFGLQGRKAQDLPFYLSEHLKGFDKLKALLVVEGEKKADVLHEVGAQVVGTVTGASCIPSESVWSSLAEFTDIILWPDNDNIGRKHMNKAAEILKKVTPAAKVRIVHSESLGLTKKGADAYDWFKISSKPTMSHLMELLETTSKTPGKDLNRPILSFGLEELLAMELKPRPWLLTNLIQERDVTMIYAPRGIGKTFSAIAIAWAVASGTSWLKFQSTSPAGVLYIDGEMPVEDLRERFNLIALGMGGRTLKPIRLLAADAIRLKQGPERNHDLLSLSTQEGQDQVEREIEDCPSIKLVIIDSVSTLCGVAGGTNESDPRSWEPMQEWLLSLRRKGIASLILHHAGKNGQQRGSSKRDDVMTQILGFKRPEDYKPREGARFEIHYSKSRAVFGEAADPVEVSMTVDPSSGIRWEYQDLERSRKERAIRLFKDGVEAREVMERIGVSKSTAHRWKNEASV